MSAIQLQHITKRYGDVTAVDDLTLSIEEGEFFSMLGPSGSGKTTVLRIIAGFEQVSSGTVALFGNDVTAMPAFERPVNTVFQDYALFPHMTVLDNVAYGLRVRGVGKGERHRQAAEALERVQLGALARRKPSELSGGQRQRVALARAIVLKPRALLLDEPLGALDLKLREQMQIELKQLQRSLGITFVFVTHDQNEALTLSDRVAVFNAGNIVQVDAPERLYDHPATEYVASFVGHSTILTPDQAAALGLPARAHSIRPERIRPDATGQIALEGTIAELIYAGPTTTLVVDVETPTPLRLSTEIPYSLRGDAPLERGERITLSFSERDLVPLAN